MQRLAVCRSTIDLLHLAGYDRVVKIEVSNRVTIRGLNPLDIEHVAIMDRLLGRFTFDNPLYWDARRNRRPCRNIPRKILLCSVESDGTTTCPRGASGEVNRLVGAQGGPVVDATALPHREPLPFKGSLRDYQELAVEAALREKQGVIQAPTGSGKTVIAMALAARVETPVLMVVHTSVLFEQTAQRIREFLGTEPGLVGGGHDEPGDVTVAMVQTLMRRDLAPWARRFGMVILDEAHHCPAETFKTVVQQFHGRYRFGLTATPKRKDRLHPVLFDVVGPIVHEVKPGTLLASGSIARAEVVEVETGYRGRYRRNDYQSLINRLVKNRDRNVLVLDSIGRYHRERSLVLTERVQHGKMLAEELRRRGMKAEAMTGDMAKDRRVDVLDRFRDGRVELLVSTVALVGEGFDLPAIDAVFLTVPNGSPGKTTQALGRALRPHAGKKSGRIVDFVDVQVPLLRNQFKRRARVYRSFN